MSLKERIAEDLKRAMKTGDRARTSTLRMVRSRILEAEVERRGDKGRDYELQDAEVVQVLSSYAKQRRDSIEAFRRGGREDLAAREEAELALLGDYLPEQLSEDGIRDLARKAIAETGARMASDLGKVMAKLMPQVQGAADGKLVNRIVRELLAG
jgi:hypothetical protein